MKDTKRSGQIKNEPAKEMKPARSDGKSGTPAKEISLSPEENNSLSHLTSTSLPVHLSRASTAACEVFERVELPLLSHVSSRMYFGSHEIDVGWPSPLPAPLPPTNTSSFSLSGASAVPSAQPPPLSSSAALFVCSKCLRLLPSLPSLNKHCQACTVPFKALYSEEHFSIALLPSLRLKQRFALLAMKFIKHKTVYLEQQDYDHYVLYGEEIMGGFSRRKGGKNSLNCIFVLPCFQKQGIASLLIDFSYSLRIKKLTGEDSKRCEKNRSEGGDGLEEAGVVKDEEFSAQLGFPVSVISDANSAGPEAPLSKKAIFCFRKYWKSRVVGAKTIRDGMIRTGMGAEAVVRGLELNGFNFKKWQVDVDEDGGENVVRAPRRLSKRVVRLVKND